jgi:hypothetical protein
MEVFRVKIVNLFYIFFGKKKHFLKLQHWPPGIATASTDAMAVRCAPEGFRRKRKFVLRRLAQSIASSGN